MMAPMFVTLLSLMSLAPWGRVVTKKEVTTRNRSHNLESWLKLMIGKDIRALSSKHIIIVLAIPLLNK
jgi:hypothetical protein